MIMHANHRALRCFAKLLPPNLVGRARCAKRDAVIHRSVLQSTVTIASLVASISLAGCGASNAALIASHPDKIAVGAKPAGYPKTYIDHLDGYCEQVTEFWRDGGMKTNGKKTWFKVTDRVTTNCPR